MGFDFKPDLPKGQNVNEAVIVADSNSKLTWPQIKASAEKGANVLIMNNDKLAASAGFTLIDKKIQRVQAGSSNLFRSISPALLRWRDPLETKALSTPPKGFTVAADGLFAEGNLGKGKIVFVQIDPLQLHKRYKDNKEKLLAVALSTERSLQLYARLLTNLGAKSGKLTAKRVIYQKGQPAFAPLKFFHVLGPFDVKKDDGKLMMDTVFPGEEMAIVGDYNPNPRFKLPQGGKADWRPTITSDSKGFVDLQKLFPNVTSAVSYAICNVERKNAGEAVLKFGVDWRAKIWCNGEQVFSTLQGSHIYKFDIKLNLKKGENLISFKIGSGVSGNNFRAKLSTEESSSKAKRIVDKELEKVQLYENLLPGWDPYTYYFW